MSSQYIISHLSLVRVKCAGLYRRRSSSQSLMLVLAGGSTSACFRQWWYSLVNLWLTSSSGGDMVLSNDRGELQFECLNTTRPRLQFSSFKATFFKSSCCNFNKNPVLHTIDQGQREALYHTIDSNMNKCHWHSPMRKQLRRALGIYILCKIIDFGYSHGICSPHGNILNIGWLDMYFIYFHSPSIYILYETIILAYNHSIYPNDRIYT